MPNQLAIVVDDESGIRRYISAVLQRAHFETREADGGTAGLRLVCDLAGDVALIVSDIHMPQGDGLSFAAAVRKSYPAVPVVLVSGFAPPTDAACDAFVEKPFSPEELLAAVREATASELPPPRPRSRSRWDSTLPVRRAAIRS